VSGGRWRGGARIGRVRGRGMLYILYTCTHMRARQADELNSLTNKPPPSPPYAPLYCIHYPSPISTTRRRVRRWQRRRRVIIITTRKATSLFSRKRFLILITTTRFNSYKYNRLQRIYIHIYTRAEADIRGTTSLANRNILNCKKLANILCNVYFCFYIPCKTPRLRLSR